MHLKTDCQFEELPCPRADCKEKILRKDLPDHVEKTCKYRETTCKYCKSQVPMIMLQVQYFLVCRTRFFMLIRSSNSSCASA